MGRKLRKRKIIMIYEKILASKMKLGLETESQKISELCRVLRSRFTADEYDLLMPLDKDFINDVLDWYKKFPLPPLPIPAPS
jgi:hypothetical protein